MMTELLTIVMFGLAIMLFFLIVHGIEEGIFAATLKKYVAFMDREFFAKKMYLQWTERNENPKTPGGESLQHDTAYSYVGSLENTGTQTARFSPVQMDTDMAQLCSENSVMAIRDTAITSNAEGNMLNIEEVGVRHINLSAREVTEEVPLEYTVTEEEIEDWEETDRSELGVLTEEELQHITNPPPVDITFNIGERVIPEGLSYLPIEALVNQGPGNIQEVGRTQPTGEQWFYRGFRDYVTSMINEGKFEIPDALATNRHYVSGAISADDLSQSMIYGTTNHEKIEVDLEEMPKRIIRMPKRGKTNGGD